MRRTRGCGFAVSGTNRLWSVCILSRLLHVCSLPCHCYTWGDCHFATSRATRSPTPAHYEHISRHLLTQQITSQATRQVLFWVQYMQLLCWGDFNDPWGKILSSSVFIHRLPSTVNDIADPPRDFPNLPAILAVLAGSTQQSFLCRSLVVSFLYSPGPTFESGLASTPSGLGCAA